MIEVTNNICKMVKSLDERKARKKEGLFKAEGTKCVSDTLGYFQLRYLIATTDWIESHSDVLSRIHSENVMKCHKREMARISSLTTPPEVVAIYEIPERILSDNCAKDNIVLALDTIQDPGNLGTIIRVADWFGITDIICSFETADCYGPKVVQATMGAISRVSVHYCDLPATISRLDAEGVYGTFLNGDSITEATLTNTGIVIIGNEGKGISESVENTVTHRLLIPSYPPERPTGESLNAAIATAITLAKFRRI